MKVRVGGGAGLYQKCVIKCSLDNKTESTATGEMNRNPEKGCCAAVHYPTCKSPEDSDGGIKFDCRFVPEALVMAGVPITDAA